jgi:hypothetical protein
MKIKKFDQALHDKYDPPARKAVSEWIQMRWGLQALDNPDIYGTDLIVHRMGKPVGFAEVEVRQWSSYCPYYTIHVPARKTEMLQVPKTLFFALTQDMTHAYWIRGSEVLKYNQIEMQDKTKHEAYFDVPKHLFKYVNLKELF